MAKGDALKGINIEIGGNTVGLTKALGDVNKTANQVQAELRLVDKALKLDPKNVELLAQKQTLLSQNISGTTDKLNQLKSVQKDVEQQYKNGDISAESYRAFQREIVSTENALKGLKNQSDATDTLAKSASGLKSKFEELKDKPKEFIQNLEYTHPSFKKMESVAIGTFNVIKNTGTATFKAVGTASKVGFETVEGAVKIAGKAFTAYIGTATAVGTATVAMTAKSGAAADEINTIAKQTGLSTAEIQKFQYASELIDVPLETVTGSMAKLTKNMQGASNGSKNTQKAFDDLGVSITDQNGQLRNNQDVFNDAITALGGMENATQRDALAMQIFGKSAQDLNPLILGGADALKTFGNDAEKSGLILSQSGLDNLNAFNDSLDIMKANTGASGKVLSSVFAGSLNQMAGAIGSAIPSITGSLSNIFTGVDVGESGKSLTNSLVGVINQLLTTLTEQLPTFLMGINTVIVAILTAITTTLPTVITTLLPALFEGFNSLMLSLIALLPVLLPLIIDGGMQLLMGLLESINLIVPPLMAQLPIVITSICTALTNNIGMIIDMGINLLISLINGIVSAIPALSAQIPQIINAIVTTLVNNIPLLIDAAMQLIMAIADAIPIILPELVKAVPQIVFGIYSAIVDAIPQMVKAGGNLIQGLLDGIMGSIGGLISEVGKGLGKFTDSILKFFKIKSPSQLLRDKIGKWLMPGIAVGFVDNLPSSINMMKSQLQKGVSSLSDVKFRINAGLQQISANRLGANDTQSQSQRGNITQYNTYNSPKALSPGESARLTKISTRRALLGT